MCDSLKGLLVEDVIVEEVRSQANQEGTVAAIFYVLPKMHKRGVPGHPVNFASNLPTEKLSEVVDLFLKTASTIYSVSHQRHSTEFLSKLRELDTIPRGCILAISDIVGLY